MKKGLILTLLSFVLVFSVGCNQTTETEATTEGNKEVAETTEATTEEEKVTQTEEVSETEESEEEETEKVWPEELKGKLTFEVDLSKHESDKPVRLWLPAAQSDEYQEISNVEVVVDEQTATTQTNKDDLGNEMIYIEFSPEAKERKATYSFDLVRKEIKAPKFAEEEDFDAAEYEEYLSSSHLMPLDGKIKELSDEITKGKETVEDKALAIHEWIFENMVRNDDVTGCGLGDVESTLVSLDGKCTDIGSVNIALLRAAGIPAREIFGVRLKDESGISDVTKSQHCWVEYYQPGTGWVTTDVADVLRAVLYEDLEKDGDKAQEIKEFYFGNLDAVRVGLTTGRDLTLVPEQEAPFVNQFGYPYAEVDGEPLDFYNPEEFAYSITFEKAE